MKKIITAPNAPAAVGPYSHAVDTGELVFVSGQLGLNPETGKLADGLEAQVRQMFANVSAILAASGLDLTHVVKTTVFMTDLANFGLLNGIYAGYFPENPPARSCFQVSALPLGAQVEMEVVAAK